MDPEDLLRHPRRPLGIIARRRAPANGETACTPHDIDTATVGTVRSGHYLRVPLCSCLGVAADRRRVTIEYIAQITADVPVPAHWPRLPHGINGAIALVVEGRPSYPAPDVGPDAR